jgi:hypothetical protein
MGEYHKKVHKTDQNENVRGVSGMMELTREMLNDTDKGKSSDVRVAVD